MKLLLILPLIFLSSCVLFESSDSIRRAVRENPNAEVPLKERANYQLSLRDWQGSQERSPSAETAAVKSPALEKISLNKSRKAKGSWNDQLRAQTYGENKRISSNKIKPGQKYPFYNVSQAYPDVQKIRFATDSAKPKDAVIDVSAGAMKAILYGVSELSQRNLSRFRAENKAIKASVSEADSRLQKTEDKVSANATVLSSAMDDGYEGNDFRTSAFDMTALENQWLFYAKGEGVQNDDDWYRVYVTPLFRNLVLDLRFQHYYGDIDMQLYNAQGELIASSQTLKDDEFINVVLAKAGFYFVRIYYSNRGNNYDLKWSAQFTGEKDDHYEENDTLRKAFDLRSQEKSWLYSVKGEAASGDDDYFMIRAESGFQRVIVDARFLNSQGDVELALFDEAGQRLALSTSVGDDELIDFVVPRAGNYFVKVYPYSKSVNVYDMRWFTLKTQSPAAEDKLEPNDKLTVANCETKQGCQTSLPVIAENQSITATQYDEDWFAIVPTASQRVQIDLTFSADAGEMYLALFNDKGEKLSESIARKDNQLIDVVVPNKGSLYFIKVYGDNVGNSYQLSWKSINTVIGDDRFEPNDLKEESFDLTAFENAWLSEIAGSAVQKNFDFYKINLKSNNSSVVVDLRYAYAKGNMQMELLNQEGQVVAYSRHQKDDEWMTYQASVAGTYYLKVYGANSGNVYDLKWSSEKLDPRLNIEKNISQQWSGAKGTTAKAKFIQNSSGQHELELSWPDKKILGRGMIRGSQAELALTRIPASENTPSLGSAIFELVSENRAVLSWVGSLSLAETSSFDLKSTTQKSSRTGAAKP